jgi:hypothetical protein
MNHQTTTSPAPLCHMLVALLFSASVMQLAARTQAPAPAEVSVRDFGAKGDGVTDDSAAIQAAIDSIQSGTVVIPATSAGYLLKPNPDKKRFLSLKSHVQLVGSGNPVLRVASGSAPYDYVIASGPCDDCAVENLTIDSNVAGNPIRDKAEILAHPRVEIGFATGKRIRVERVTVKNSSAVNSVTTGEPSSNVLVSHCAFVGDGDDPNHVQHDRSSLYIYADGAVLDSNTFTAVRRGAPAAVTAIETHGSDITVSNNVVTDFAAGMNITGVASKDSTGNAVRGNTIRGAAVGMQIWSVAYRKHVEGYGINGLTVTGNTIELAQSAYAVESTTGSISAGIYFQPHSNLPAANITISGNTIVFELEHSVHRANTASMGIGYWSATGQTVENLVIANNSIDNAPVAGIRLAAKLVSCQVTGNRIRNAGSSLDPAIPAGYKTPVFIAGAPATDVDISGNQISDTLPSSRMRVAFALATTAGRSSGVLVRNNTVSLTGANRSSFVRHVEIGDDNTQPVIEADWDDFAPPARKVGAGSRVTDSKNRAAWRSENEGSLTRQR